jgi:nucleolar pre-ribosomal-associated protein 2
MLCTSTRHTFAESIAPQLFSKLCVTIRLIVLVYAESLRGRMHLLVPVLKALLTCLFTIHPNSKPPKGLKPPTWIQTKKVEREGSDMGKLYSRLLLTWTQPTMNAATLRPMHTADYLVDRTRVMRERVAGFVPEVLAHFCRMHLVGSLAPDARAALLPGVWACIGAVTMERLRVMNADLGTDERAIWRSLWVEFRRSNGLPVGDEAW